MQKGNNYYLLAALFLGFYLVVQFTDIYGKSTWFKAFLIILGVAFLISGLSNKKNNNNQQS